MRRLVKSELIEILAARCGITSSESEKILNKLQGIITEALSEDVTVLWNGFGRFSVVTAKESVRRSPTTKELVTVPEHRRVKFIVGQVLREKIYGTNP